MPRSWYVTGWCLVGASVLVAVGMVVAMFLVSPEPVFAIISVAALFWGWFNIREMWLARRGGL